MRLTQRPTPNPTSPIPHKIVVDSPNSLSLSLSLSLSCTQGEEEDQTLTLESFIHMDQRTSQNDNDNRRLYNPYQDLQIPIQNIYKLPTSPEFLFQEESVAQRRSWGENLTYYTGIGYLSGALSGAAKGLVDGVKASEPGDTVKLRINRILNASGHAGRKFGNRAGVIGLMYAGLESGIVAVRDTDDVVNSVVAGLGTGALYRAAAGVRSAAVAGAIGGVVVGAAVTAKQVLKRYVPI
ncbi:hypothetical protein VitviT2T_013214 [Vitis vinifera]|uniref:Mitochondrial import inner membrane translocase subunit TIM23-1 n=2 Tax=Vitis vinifera TaxID=29760 RepID=A0ABY9CHU2_VITVI|nr:mitochondrial import inner membrane translocase subunit TIM23-1 [Vitis vinifera]WJZ94342.1 hypothetical protein VitviT2T_013214 [Vitis vinifera]|eukprot:XP_002278010.2 PREDICTED: mitochondrial import inner membrane translocase subunit TIM23-1 [Vitis vinifera]